MGTAHIQGPLWGARAKDWADVQEGQSASLFTAVLNRIDLATDTRVLDIACGAGTFCRMAAQQGAVVSGLDASETLIAIARGRVPQGDFQVGDMETLPYANAAFDVVTGFSAFTFAEDRGKALQEARRVVRNGGRVVIAVWGKPEDNEADACLDALFAFLPPPSPGVTRPSPLYTDGALEAFARQADLVPERLGEVDCGWDYVDEQTAIRGFLSTSVSVLAIRQAGEAPVREAVTHALAPFRMPFGRYRLRNRFRYLVARAE